MRDGSRRRAYGVESFGDRELHPDRGGHCGEPRSHACPRMPGGHLFVQASPAWTESAPGRLVHARAIRAEVNARARLLPGVRLTISEPTTTAVVESFALLSQDLLETRYVPAERGIWYAICPARAVCPYPRPPLSRPAADYLPRRLALEPAVRTFVETDARVVAVSLPTPRFTTMIVTREDWEKRTSPPPQSLREGPMLASSAPLRLSVDELTCPRTYVFLGLEPGANGGPSWGACRAGRLAASRFICHKRGRGRSSEPPPRLNRRS